MKTSNDYRREILGLIVSIVVCFSMAWIGSAATSANLADWYAGITRPSWNPPNWIFGPVWATLYTMMAFAVWLVWRKSGWKMAGAAIGCFGIQLILNSLWSVLFFGMQNPLLAGIEIVLLLLAIGTTIVLFNRHSKLAAGLMVPYFLWVSFATVLNWTIWNLNR